MTEPITLLAERVPLDSAQPERTRVGRLDWRGGLRLSSPDARLGGLSDLRVGAGGQTFVAVSDEGWRLSGRLVYDPGGWLVGVADTRIAALTGAGGVPLAGKAERDAEALVVDADGGMIVAFEQRHRLLRYPAGGDTASTLATPPGLDAAPGNGGIEALAVVAGGRLLALSEGLALTGGNAAWMSGGNAAWISGGEAASMSGGEAALTSGGDAAWQRRVWRTDPGFRPTAAATLASGDVLVLERMFPPPAARIRLLPVEALTREVLDGEEIARFEGSLTYDNMEGIDAVQTAGGETLIFLLSDDNYSPLQQTLLLSFRLDQ